MVAILIPKDTGNTHLVFNATWICIYMCMLYMRVCVCVFHFLALDYLLNINPF